MPRDRRRHPAGQPPRDGHDAPGIRGHGAHPVHGDTTGEPALLSEVRDLLLEPVPWPLFELVSALLAAVEGPGADPFARVVPVGAQSTDLGGLVRTFLDLDTPESTALLTVIAELSPDELMIRRIRRGLDRRLHHLPAWLDRPGPPQVTGVLELSHIEGDGDNIALGVRAAGGDDGTLVVYVDHNLGTLVKDAFIVEGPLDALAGRFREAATDDPDLTLTELSHADAGARLREALAPAGEAHHALQTDTWPATRPLLEWVARQLPPEGRGYRRAQWPPSRREQLAAEFLRSPQGRDHDHVEGRELLATVVGLACDRGVGDPLRWSPARVELLLFDWLPREAPAPRQTLTGAPDLLMDLTRFGHARLGLRAQLTQQTLQAIRACTPEYDHLLRRSDPDAAVAALARIAGGDETSRWEVAFDDDLLPVGYRELLLGLLREAVGGEAALAALDTAPLPDEALDLGAVADDLVDRVREVAVLTDTCCEHLLDHEHRTACRRLLADVAAADPRVLRRGRAGTAAAAVVWIVCRANHSFDPHRPGGLSAGQLSEWFGIAGGPSARAGTLLRALGVDEARHHGRDVRLGSPRYLVAARRRAILEHRGRLDMFG